MTYEYKRVHDLTDVNDECRNGWRLHTIVCDRYGKDPYYVLEKATAVTQ